MPWDLGQSACWAIPGRLTPSAYLAHPCDYRARPSRGRLYLDIQALADWLKRSAGREPVRLIFTGIVLAWVWLNFIGALAPEIRSDATRQRLATAVHFAKIGSVIPTDPDLTSAKDLALGEIIYAVAVTIGPIQSAKLIHWMVGLLALGRRLGGDWAGALAAFAFYATMMVAYLSQTAYLDLFTSLFAIAAALSLTINRRAAWQAAIAAGICIGLGVAIKIHFGYVAVGLAVTAGSLVVCTGYRHALRQVAILTAVEILVASPWLLRSYLLFSLSSAPLAAPSMSQRGGEPATGISASSSTRYSASWPWPGHSSGCNSLTRAIASHLGCRVAMHI